MAVQRWTIARIGGKAAAPLLSRFARWHERSKAIERRQSPCWPKREQAGIDRFVAALHKHAHEPPVLYYSEHVDCWTIGLFHDLREIPATCFVECRYQLACIDLASHRLLQNALARALRSRKRHQEDRWFFTSLQHASGAWHALVPTGALVIVRETLSGISPLDHEVTQACGASPTWLSRRIKRR